MPDNRKPIPPNPPRWKPSSNPASIEVPGLDTTASVTDQIEQIEQLITIKLQNIDENFSKIHNVLANKILPAVKRYAVGTEPVREAAQFWTSFYEQAAQIRIPTYDEDYSTVNDVPSERGESDTTTTQDYDGTPQDYSMAQDSRSYEPSMAHTESSFMPAQGAISSTPATSRKAAPDDSFLSHGSDDPSWTRTLQSPLVRLSREIQSLSNPDDIVQPGDTTSTDVPSMRYHEPSPDRTQRDESILPRSEKSKGKGPLLKNVLRHNLYSASDISSGIISPIKLKGKPKTPVPKNLNPYLPSTSDSSNWSGLVDLRDQSLLTPQRGRLWKKPRGATTTPAHDSDDDSFDGLPPGMSPPVMLSPARPKKLQLGKTPGKEASARIMKDLLRDIQTQKTQSGGQKHLYNFSQSRGESSLSSVPTPPSLSHYRSYRFDISSSATNDSTFDSMLKRVGLDIPVPKSNVKTTTSEPHPTPGLRIRPRSDLLSDTKPNAVFAPPSENAGPIWAATDDPLSPGYDSDSDSDSMEDINDTAVPSAAFLMASQGHHSDDSFGSNHSSDSLNEEPVGVDLITPVHPFAGAVEDNGFDDEDDSYEDDLGEADYPEETLFGVPPAQRLQGRVQHPTEGVRMLGEDLLAALPPHPLHGHPEESPIPPSWGTQNQRES
ncbi:hypothetical protein BDQ17DRAFT_1233650 [Cyathus striatus]|nr:hypothetical protein BDQ17DRAFT_1233650 [Cyathus striatus]